jgi:hypothetical protein
MTTLDRPRGHTPRPNARLVSDGVIASYLHDISQRHRRYPADRHHASPQSGRASSAGDRRSQTEAIDRSNGSAIGLPMICIPNGSP